MLICTNINAKLKEWLMVTLWMLLLTLGSIFFILVGSVWLLLIRPSSMRNVNELMIKECHAVKYNAENKALVHDAHMANRAILIEKGLFVPVEK